jgi:hypothetical protein
VIEFKREVYQKALEELARYLRRHVHRQRHGTRPALRERARATDRG